MMWTAAESATPRAFLALVVVVCRAGLRSVVVQERDPAPAAPSGRMRFGGDGEEGPGRKRAREEQEQDGGGDDDNRGDGDDADDRVRGGGGGGHRFERFAKLAAEDERGGAVGRPKKKSLHETGGRKRSRSRSRSRSQPRDKPRREERAGGFKKPKPQQPRRS
eukprot:scaffold3361_cov188-Prasinococcus_capsulatus_cf.AAC.1